MCQWSPAWAQLLHCCPARLPDVASAAFSHVDWNQHYISFACVLSSLLLSVLLCCPLLIVHAAHSANEPVQAQSAFYERDSHIFKGEIKPHITTAQMEQRHMTDNHVQKKKSKYEECVYVEKNSLLFFPLLLSLFVFSCPPVSQQQLRTLVDPIKESHEWLNVSLYSKLWTSTFACIFVCASA